MRETFEPLILRFIPAVVEPVSIKMNTANTNQVISNVKAEWNKFFPGNTFE
ncbi:MAG: hypothetical protein ABJB05_05565 [Parafilimonas sp.]